MSSQVKGYLLTFVSVISVSNVYIFSKAALNEVSLAQFGIYWFGLGLIWISIYAIKKKSFQKINSFKPNTFVLFLILGSIELVATYFFFKSICTIPNPAITSFLGNISPVFVLTLSFVFLKERLNRLEIVGVILALSGAFIIGYKGGFDIKTMFINGTQYVVFSTFLFATISVIFKKYIQTLSPVLIALNRILFLLIFSVISIYSLNQEITIPISAFKNIFIGSILGPFLTAVTGLLALQYIDLSKKSMISSTKSLFIVLGAYLYFGQFPRVYEILGGVLSIFGVLLILFEKMKQRRIHSK